MAGDVILASHDEQNGKTSEIRLDLLLPLIRVRKDARNRRDIVGLYRDELISVRRWKGSPVPESVHGEDGAGELRAMGEASRHCNAIYIDAVKSLVVEKRSLLRSWYRFRVEPTEGRGFEFRVLAHETPVLIRALSGLLGDRLEQKRRIRFLASPIRFGIFLGMVALMCILYAVGRGDTIRSLLGPPIAETLASVIGWGLVIFVPIWLLVEGLDVIPLGYAEPKPAAGGPGKDLSRRRPFRSLALGRVLRIVGALLIVGWLGNVSLAISEHFTPFAPQGDTSSLAGTVFNLAWIVLGSTLVYLGHAMSGRSAKQETAVDDRPHTLYLRSFVDDNANNLNPQTVLAHSCGLSTPWPFSILPFPLRQIFNLHPLRLLRAALGTLNDSSEQQLGRYFRQLGPFVAIGKPGERFASLGASREYVDQDGWKDVVTHFMDGARYVVLQPARTEGIWWEIKTVLSRVPRDRIVFCMSNFRGRQDDYDEFRVRLEEEVGVALPRSIGNRDEILFAYFDPIGSPRVHSLSYLSPLVWPFLGQVADIRRTLLEFVEPSHKGTAPYLKGLYEGHTFPASVLTMLVIPLLLAGFGSLGSFGTGIILGDRPSLVGGKPGLTVEMTSSSQDSGPGYLPMEPTESLSPGGNLGFTEIPMPAPPDARGGPGTAVAEAAESTAPAEAANSDIPPRIAKQSPLEEARWGEMTGDWKRAIQIYRALIEKQPDSVDLHFQLSELFRRRGNLGAAIEEAREVARRVRVDPRGFEGGVYRNQLTRCLCLAGRFEEALPLARENVKWYSSSSVKDTLAHAAYGTGHWDEAVRAWDAVLADSPDYFTTTPETCFEDESHYEEARRKAGELKGPSDTSAPPDPNSDRRGPRRKRRPAGRTKNLPGR